MRDHFLSVRQCNPPPPPSNVILQNYSTFTHYTNNLYSLKKSYFELLSEVKSDFKFVQFLYTQYIMDMCLFVEKRQLFFFSQGADVLAKSLEKMGVIIYVDSRIVKESTIDG